MSDSIFFKLIVEILVEFTKLFDTVGDTISQILIGLRFLMPLAIYFKESFIVGPDNINAQTAAFCTLRVI